VTSQVLFGQKYGYRPLPTIIRGNELEMLVDVITRDETSAADAQLLQQWYRKDENSVEPIYVLQSISSIITNFKNKVIPLPKKLHRSAACDLLNKTIITLHAFQVSKNSFIDWMI